MFSLMIPLLSIVLHLISFWNCVLRTNWVDSGAGKACSSVFKGFIYSLSWLPTPSLCPISFAAFNLQWKPIIKYLSSVSKTRPNWHWVNLRTCPMENPVSFPPHSHPVFFLCIGIQHFQNTFKSMPHFTPRLKCTLKGRQKHFYDSHSGKRPPPSIWSNKVNVLLLQVRERGLLCRQFLWTKLGADLVESFGEHEGAAGRASGSGGWVGVCWACCSASWQRAEGDPAVYWCWADAAQLNWCFLVAMTTDQAFCPQTWPPAPLLVLS